MSDTAPASPSEPDPVRVCEECGADISHLRSIARFCSKTCTNRAYARNPKGQERRLAAKRAYRARPGVMERELAQQAEHRARPEVRERRLAADKRHKAANKEHRREGDRAYRARPEVKERIRERQRLRRARRCKECGLDIRHLHGNATFCSKECWRKNYIARPGVKERHAAALRRWQARTKAEREAQQAEAADHDDDADNPRRRDSCGSFQTIKNGRTRNLRARRV